MDCINVYMIEIWWINDD